MVSEVPSTPNEPGFQATENSSGLSIPFPPVVLLLVFALSGVPLGMGAVSGYFFSFHLFCRQAKKKKKLSLSRTSPGLFKPSESCTQTSLLPACCNVLANETLF